MVKEIQFVSIKEGLSRVLRHPLLQGIQLEDMIQHIIDFIGLHGSPKMYVNKETEVHIKDFRALLPCDLVSINQVKDKKSGICIPHMSDTFAPKEANRDMKFKTQGRVIMCSWKDCDLIISYRAIPVDEEGYPLLIDNAVFLKALEAYIKMTYFSYFFDEGKINANVMEKAERDYYALARQLQGEFELPSYSEMEGIKNDVTRLIPRQNSFEKGFEDLSTREVLRTYR